MRRVFGIAPKSQVRLCSTRTTVAGVGHSPTYKLWEEE